VYKAIRPLLFKTDPEKIHHLILLLMQFAGEIYPVNWVLNKMFSAPEKRVDAFGLSFRNPLGLAAGFDKDGLGFHGLGSLGFGHIEIGTVTLKAQSGNPKPRLFRLPEDQALINRLGFPSYGAETVLNRIKEKHPKDLIIGVNIGKNKDTQLEGAANEYVTLLQMFSPVADYIVINISSPNTVGLRRLQAREALDDLLKSIEDERRKLSKRKPVLVKIAPDLSEVELADSVEIILKNYIDGVIATNTTISRQGLRSPRASEQGGLSGKPLHAMSVEMVAKIYQLSEGRLPVIGAGGVTNASSVQEFLDAGATLVQIYTGLVYEGPGLVKRILNELT
jgi:dihydroorotate dehydrogenase